MDEGHEIWYCGEDSKHQYGVAFIVKLYPHPKQTHLHSDFSESFSSMHQLQTM